MVTRRSRPRRWPLGTVAAVLLVLVGAGITYRSLGSSTADAAHVSRPVRAPYSADQLTGAMLGSAFFGAGFLAQPVDRAQATTGCLQLDDALALHGRNHRIVRQGFINSSNGATIVEQLRTESSDRMGAGFDAAAAALGTCATISFVAPGAGRLPLTTYAQDAFVNGVPTVARKLQGVVGGVYLTALIGIAHPTPASELVLIYLNPADVTDMTQALDTFVSAASGAHNALGVR